MHADVMELIVDKKGDDMEAFWENACAELDHQMRIQSPGQKNTRLLLLHRRAMAEATAIRRWIESRINLQWGCSMESLYTLSSLV